MVVVPFLLWNNGSGGRFPAHFENKFLTNPNQATPDFKTGHQGSKQASTGSPKRTYCERRTNSVHCPLDGFSIDSGGGAAPALPARLNPAKRSGI